ncbi:MAG: TetR/AcrR family transcriptional regulator [Burkholderiaceae bacterium]|nr:TetR/AcrR family transcriptional regulator [Burkholderiaceae bacterium]
MVDTLVNSDRAQTNPESGSGTARPAAQAAQPGSIARRRMSLADRERHIVDGAITFFSENGLAAQMRDLARAIGVTHALVYHYFPTKQALVDRVYLEVFEGRWKAEWETLLDRKDLSVEDKLVQFYEDYSRTVLTREFVRILVFSGLTDQSITDRFFKLLTAHLFPRLIRETRRFRGSTSRAKTTAREHELLMGLHGGVFYGGMRWYIYGQAVHASQPALDDTTSITDRVRGYLSASMHLDPQPAS